VNMLLEQVSLILPDLDTSVDFYGPVSATHIGPGAIGVVVYEGL
jgi:hypothetical protein